MECYLRQVPLHIFPKFLWSEFASHFATQEIAMERLSVQPYGQYGFLQEPDLQHIASGCERTERSEKVYELGKELIGWLKKNLAEERLLATGIELGYSDRERVSIPPNLFGHSWFSFKDGRVSERHCGFCEVIVSRNEQSKFIAAEIVEQCIEWLHSKQRDGITARKVLEHGARKTFGSKLTARRFTLAYAHVFKNSLGRPRKNRQH